MRSLVITALAAIVSIALACTPKTGQQSSATPAKPTEPLFDTISKPVMYNAEEEPEEEPMEEYNLLEGAEVTPASEPSSDSLRPYNPSHTFEHDLLHTKIEISFDWAKKRALGKATLTLRPWFYPTSQLTLDAKNFDIHSVSFDGQKNPLKYTYNNEQLVIDLGKTFTRNDEFKVSVSYTAKPDERESIGGSAAITQDKGLYFINPDGSDAEKPKQIWTQGETESNSFWFPTIDKPNERCTQEMYITVDNKYKTLSNGVMVSSKKNADGTRTDYWKMDKPHAPYLFMMAIGEYAVVKDKWRGIDVDYYVEPKYEADARDIFPYTTEMLEFFSNKLNYTYPWPKYSQVIVRDYVSGAMENTSAVIFGEFMQHTKRELLDDSQYSNEKIVAHEMFHHWFGDLVTTESWANLALNEGFANYSEYLWVEHKHGRDAADFHEMQERDGYYMSAGDGGHPLVDFEYKDREAMFDAHSYNKGGAILHMLRTIVGDDAFFTALNRYLKKNEYTDVEAHELRLAFEDVTGQDLNWFFNQWFFSAGHPNLEVSYNWDESARQMQVSVNQTQETGAKVPNVFELPLAIDIYDASGKARRENIRTTQRNQTFTFNCNEKPALVIVDAERALLGNVVDNHTPDEWTFMYFHGPRFADRWNAFDALEQLEDPTVGNEVFEAALKDPFWVLRIRAMQKLDFNDPQKQDIIARFAESDPDLNVRASAISMLSETGDAKFVPLLKKGLEPTQSYGIVGASLSGLVKIDPKAAMDAAKTLENDENDAIVNALCELYGQNPDASNAAWFAQKAAKVDNMTAFSFFDAHAKFVIGLNNDQTTTEAVSAWKNTALNKNSSLWRRFACTKAIADVRNALRENGNTAKASELSNIIEEIKAAETDETLKMYYGMF